MMSNSYISIVLANRNDGYGGDQADRFRYFIQYYANFAQQYPGLFEFVICDWNPPADQLPLEKAFPWHQLGLVKFVTVSKEIHQRYAKKCRRVILDYIGRNVCIRQSSAPWILILNQDILISPGIMAYIAQRKLQEKYFYRADRVDFDFEKFKKEIHENDFFTAANQYIKKRHGRPFPKLNSEEMSPDITAEQSKKYLHAPTKLDFYDEKEKIIYGVGHSDVLKKYGRYKKIKMIFSKNRQELKFGCWDRFCENFGLHTNASGDFLIASKEAFEKIHGFPETTEFYMHTDSHGVVQLFAAGYIQAIFTGKECVLHADHPRHDRAIKEKWQFVDHVIWFNKMCYGLKSYRFNRKNWGLKNIALPTTIVD